MNVPFLDLRSAYRELQIDLDAAAQRVLESGQYILGAEVEVRRIGEPRAFQAFAATLAEGCSAAVADSGS